MHTDSGSSRAPTAEALPRLVIYGVGRFGQQITRLAASKGWPVVAAFNRDGAKVGQDLGELAGCSKPLGVRVQSSDTDHIEVDADVAIVCVADRLQDNLPIYRQLFEAGINVLCHGAQSMFPYGNDPATAREIDTLAKRHGVTFTGGGAWDLSRVWTGLLACGASTEISALRHRSLTNCAAGGPDLMRGYGVGLNHEEFMRQIAHAPSRYGDVYKTVASHVLKALGYSVTDVTERREPLFNAEPTPCAPLGRTLDPSECVGMDLVAEAQSAEGVTLSMNAEFRVFGEGDAENFTWEVAGNPSCRMVFERGDAVLTTAGLMLNRTPDVLAAPPGIQDITTLGIPRPTALIQTQRS